MDEAKDHKPPLRRPNEAAAVSPFLLPPILTQTWLSTLKEMTTDPLGSIWARPRDYRDVTANTRYALDPTSENAIYYRRPEREAFIESAIVKQRLLNSD